MMVGIQAHFLDEEWVQDHTFEFDEMTFRNKGHEQESPLEYIQRRIRHHHFLHPDKVDGAMAVARILRQQPVEWSQHLNETLCPTILATQSVAKRMKNSLLASWQQAERNKRPALYYRNNRPHAVEVEPVGQEISLDSYLSDEEGEGEKDLNFVANSNHKTNPRAPRNGGQKVSSLKEFPHGKTFNGVTFERDNSKVSPRLPNGDCYICTSPKHFHRDCPLGKWNVLRNAHKIHVEWETGEEEEAEREYLVMLAETKTVISAYKSERLLKAYALEVHTTQGRYGNSPAAEERVGLAAKERNERNNEPQVGLNYHKVHSKHRNAHKVKGFDKGKGKVVDTDSLTNEPVKRKGLERIFEPGRVFPAIKGHSLPEGMGSLGTKALHMQAKIGSLKSDSIRAQLDSGADITLISEEFWKSMINAPRLREGMKMKLYHLTGGAKVLGYIKTELYALARDESIVSFKLEAYVVRNMNMSILLGEDFQTTYELSVTRYASGHCDVAVG